MVARGGERVQPAVEEIKRQLQRAPVVNVDETGGHVKGVLKWVHGAATDRLTLLGIDDRRGVVGIRALGVLEELTGIVIHDAWPAYWSARFEKLSGHGLCNAHYAEAGIMRNQPASGPTLLVLAGRVALSSSA